MRRSGTRKERTPAALRTRHLRLRAPTTVAIETLLGLQQQPP